MIPPKYPVIFNLLLTLTVNNLSIPLQLHHVKKVYVDWQKHLKKQRQSMIHALSLLPLLASSDSIVIY